jgi:hypothetical protein
MVKILIVLKDRSHFLKRAKQYPFWKLSEGDGLRGSKFSSRKIMRVPKRMLLSELFKSNKFITPSKHLFSGFLAFYPQICNNALRGLCIRKRP